MYNLINLFHDCEDTLLTINKYLNQLSLIMLRMVCKDCQKLYKKMYITPYIINCAMDTQNVNILEWLYNIVGARFDCHYAVKMNYVLVLQWMSTKLGIPLWNINTLSLYMYIISIDILNLYDQNDYDFSRSRIKTLAIKCCRSDIIKWLHQRELKRIALGQDLIDYKGPDCTEDKPFRFYRGFVEL